MVRFPPGPHAKAHAQILSWGLLPEKQLCEQKELLPFSQEVPVSARTPRRTVPLTLLLLLTRTDPPVQPQLAHDAQYVHFPSGLQLLTAYAGGDEAAGPANPCTGCGRGAVGGHRGVGNVGLRSKLQRRRQGPSPLHLGAGDMGLEKAGNTCAARSRHWTSAVSHWPRSNPGVPVWVSMSSLLSSQQRFLSDSAHAGLAGPRALLM